MSSASTKSAMLDRLKQHKLVLQFLEYLVGGGLYFWVGLGVFFICYNLLHWHWLVAKGLSDLIGWTINYLVQRYWAFNDKRLQGKDRSTLTRFVIVNVIDLVIDYAIVAAIIHFGFSPYVGFFVSAIFTTGWDYFWYRFWVFKPEA